MFYDREYFRKNYKYPVHYANHTFSLSYCKAVMFSAYEAAADHLVSCGVVRGGDVVLNVGCGYNWLGQALHEKYSCTVYGTDTSPFIQSTYMGSDGDEVRKQLMESCQIPGIIHVLASRYSSPAPVGFGPILPEDSISYASRLRVLRVMGRNPDVVILHDVLNDMDAGDAEELTRACKQYGTRIVVCLGAADEGGLTHKVV